MNKPAPKEPSMDEILSSIRQIIADDDAAATPKPAGPPAPKPGLATSAAIPNPAGPSLAPRPTAPQGPAPGKAAAGWTRPAEAEDKPLALSPSQIVTAEDKPATRPKTFAEIIEASEPVPAKRDFDVPAELVDPDDVTFVGDDTPAKTPAPTAFVPKNPRLEARPAASVATAAPMPDPKLSSDMAEQLLEPATRAAIRGNFSKLSSLTSVGSGVTIEAMMREMLRPMLKEWLDENLPAVVERMVEKEIARVSRGVE